MQTITLSPRLRIILSVLALLPAALIVLVGSSTIWAPGNPVYRAMERLTADPQALHLFNLITPILILGGLALALALNLLPGFNFSLRKEGDEVVSTMRIKIEAPGLVLIIVALMLLGVVLGYALAENWQCLVGLKSSC